MKSLLEAWQIEFPAGVAQTQHRVPSTSVTQVVLQPGQALSQLGEAQAGFFSLTVEASYRRVLCLLPARGK